ncbi:MAG TPA: FKBP-type peptidyl-prolyl cis-trans isomerase [Cytophagaceae bacterium]|jgi:FKBP-type peptidyl-prolyl cis-trans isomerase SlyD|nr:FKBP-type peptidyl-prolyl cis-trans isomerase [Cytophagaceae bacterium]
MHIKKDTVVTLSYELHTDNVEGKRVHVETAGPDQPLVFLFGTGSMIPKFEEELENLKKGDGFEFDIVAEEAYGAFDESAIVKLPADVFKVEGKFEKEKFHLGMVLPMKDQHGNMLQGKILEITDEGIELDFNHPMAGQDLFFKGTILEVREATKEELEHGHVHGPGGHHHH